MENEPIKRRPSLIRRILRLILRSRFEPIETVLAGSAVLHGLWLIIPYWAAARGDISITPAPRLIELIVGGVLFLLGAAHLASLQFVLDTFRKHVAFVKFMAWFFFAGMAYVTVGPASVIWLGYLTIAFISSIIYLNISVRED